jgi:hypothetical protein
MTPTSLTSVKLHEWLMLRDRVDQLKAELMDSVKYEGDEDSGHHYLSLHTPVEWNGKTYAQLKRERRARVIFSEEKTRDLLEEKERQFHEYSGEHRDFLSRVFKPEVTMTFDSDELYVLYQEDILTEQDLDGLMETSYSYAFKPVAE